jgi:tetratricopeptide (TPR) repeat protein
LSRNLSTAEVSRIVGLRESSVRALVRSGLCRPGRQGRRYAFSFQDLVVLRAARGLLDRGVPMRRVRAALGALIRELPAERPLSGMRIYADGQRVAVRDGGRAWEPETGQTLLDFRVDELAELAEAARDEVKPLDSDRATQARAEFEYALELEDRDPGGAADAYARCLELDGDLIDAYVNLGRLAHEAGDAARAAELCRRALERSPDDPLIHFNLALALEDTEGPVAAARHYERALAIDDDFADAHYNLAGLCERLGRRADALRHYRAYRQLTVRPD